MTEDRKACLDGLRALRGKGDRTRTIACYQQALAINPKEPLYYHLLHHEYRMKLAYSQALKVIRKGLVQAGDDPLLLSDLAELQIVKGELDQAAATLDRCEALPEGKEKGGTCWIRARLAEAGHDYPAAIEYYDQAGALAKDASMKDVAAANKKRLQAMLKAGK